MNAWGKGTTEEYRDLPIAAHSYLHDVPVLDVWWVFLPGRERRCTMEEVRALALAMADDGSPGIGISSLFALRRVLGVALRWDRDVDTALPLSLTRRIPEDARRRSLVPPGTRDGPFHIQYLHSDEAVGAIRNATVEAYLVWAVHPVPEGHVVTWAVHALPTGALTRPYLALIRPFRHLFVYPYLLQAFHDAWGRGRATPTRTERS